MIWRFDGRTTRTWLPALIPILQQQFTLLGMVSLDAYIAQVPRLDKPHIPGIRHTSQSMDAEALFVALADHEPILSRVYSAVVCHMRE